MIQISSVVGALNTHSWVPVGTFVCTESHYYSFSGPVSLSMTHLKTFTYWLWLCSKRGNASNVDSFILRITAYRASSRLYTQHRTVNITKTLVVLQLPVCFGSGCPGQRGSSPVSKVVSQRLGLSQWWVIDFGCKRSGGGGELSLDLQWRWSFERVLERIAFLCTFYTFLWLTGCDMHRLNIEVGGLKRGGA